MLSIDGELHDNFLTCNTTFYKFQKKIYVCLKALVLNKMHAWICLICITTDSSDLSFPSLQCFPPTQVDSSSLLLRRPLLHVIPPHPFFHYTQIIYTYITWRQKAQNIPKKINKNFPHSEDVTLKIQFLPQLLMIHMEAQVKAIQICLQSASLFYYTAMFPSCPKWSTRCVLLYLLNMTPVANYNFQSNVTGRMLVAWVSLSVYLFSSFEACCSKVGSTYPG